MTLRNLSLFTGSGIGDLAAHHAGIQTVAMCEQDPWCLYALGKLWPEVTLFKDVKDVSADALRNLFPIDIISGGFPCQDISCAGKGAGIEGSRSGLWREMFRIIRQVRPAWLVIENVPALRNRGSDRVIAPLERIGYTCWPLVVGAWAVGAPHKRDRVWIVAHAGNRREHQRTWGPRRENWERTPERRIAPVCGDVADAQLPEPWTGTGQEPPAEFGRDRPAIHRACGELADTDEARREKHPRQPSNDGTQQPAAVGSRWPSRPGERQHGWESPRLAQFTVGGEFTRMARELHDRLDGSANGVRPDQAASQANKAMLRILGNGWVYPLAQLIFSWIAEQECGIMQVADGVESTGYSNHLKAERSF